MSSQLCSIYNRGLECRQPYTIEGKGNMLYCLLCFIPGYLNQFFWNLYAVKITRGAKSDSVNGISEVVFHEERALSSHSWLSPWEEDKRKVSGSRMNNSLIYFLKL